MPDSIITINDHDLYLVHADTPLSDLAHAIQESGNEYSEMNYTAISENVGILDLSEYLLNNYDRSFLSGMLLYMHKQWPELFNSTPMHNQENTVESFKVYNLKEYLALHGVSRVNNPYFCIVSNDTNFAKLLSTMISNKAQGQAFIEKLTKKPGAYSAFIKPIGGVESLYDEAYSKKSWNYAYPIIQFSV